MIVRKTVMRKTYAPSLEMADIKGSPEDIMKLFKDEQKRGVGDGFYWDQVKTTKPDFAKKYGQDPSKEYPVVFTTQEKAFLYVNQLLKSEFTVTGRWFFGEE
jgi:hypothetical protein